MDGAFASEELELALRHVSMPLEALRYDVTPVGLHYTLCHFDIPALDESAFRLRVVDRTLSMAQLQGLEKRTVRATLECAGNGRAKFQPRYPSMPWTQGGVSTADWTGVPLKRVLGAVSPRTAEVVFTGADRGFDSGVEHAFARSLPLEEAMRDDVLLAWEMNGQPLAPQHGAPLRLVVPGWFGMASVKWLSRIELLDRPFDGYQQATGYQYKKRAGEDGTPVRQMKVKSLIAPPGIADWYSGRRLVDAGPVTVTGRAWSAAPIKRVEFAVDGEWRDADLEEADRYAWRRWRCEWKAEPGEHELACRATDVEGTQPNQPDWNIGGMGNNALHRLRVTVR